MKTFTFFRKFILMVLFWSVTNHAQDKMFLFTATNAVTDYSTYTAYTFLDHPLLTAGGYDVDYPVAVRVRNGIGDAANAPLWINKRFNGTEWKHTINSYGETILPGMQFMVYIPDNNKKYIFYHSTSPTEGGILTLDHPDFNGYASLNLMFLSGSYYSDKAYGIYFNSAKWKIFTEDNSNMGVATFNVIKGGDDVQTILHTVTSANMNPSFNYATVLQSSYLNNNPNGLFVFCHTIKENHIQTTKQFKAEYIGNRWNISTADFSPMPMGIEFNVYIYKYPPLATQDLSKDSQVQTYPNPIKDIVNFASAQTITKIEIYDLSGKLLKQSDHHEKSVSVNVSALSAGTYIAKVATAKGIDTIKLIKK